MYRATCYRSGTFETFRFEHLASLSALTDAGWSIIALNHRS
jgi:hypothetical protein